MINSLKLGKDKKEKVSLLKMYFFFLGYKKKYITMQLKM